jgi:hypothetical protein
MRRTVRAACGGAPRATPSSELKFDHVRLPDDLVQARRRHRPETVRHDLVAAKAELAESRVHSVVADRAIGRARRREDERAVLRDLAQRFEQPCDLGGE